MRTKLRVVAYGLAVTATLVGCGATSADPVGEDVEFQEYVQETIVEAREGGASDAQLALLDLINDSGTLSVEDMKIAARNAVDCMLEAGVVAEYTEEVTEAGILLPGYRAQISESDPAIEELVYECDFAEQFWAGKLYALQPSSRSVTDAYVQERLPYLSACLTENDVPVDESATQGELFDSAMLLLRDTDINCFQEAGIDGA